ncbi:MAG: NrfD/PsrC family molybdoenzyme membrane anchor subunit [Gemmatimonadota bacterium]
MQETTTTRVNALIDPSMHIWHYEVPVYLFLGGLVAGLMVITGLWMLRGPDGPRSRALWLMPWAAPALISVGMLFLWLDLENPFNAFRFYFTFELTSPMSWGSWILLGVYPASILLAWASTPADTRDRWLMRLSRVPGLGRLDAWVSGHVPALAGLNVVLGAALGVYTGVLLGTMAARPLWNSAILGPLFLVSGLSTGAAFMMLYRLERSEKELLSRVDMGLISVELLLLALWMIGLAAGGAASRAGLHTIMGGPYTAAFWTLVVALGLLTPLIGEWLEHRHSAVPARLTAALVLIGGLALRWIIVYAGQHSGWVTDLASR